MRKPEPDELKAALAGVEEMRAEGNDPRHIALSLRYLYTRSQRLEELLKISDRYLRFGMPEHELSEMRRLVSRLREEAQSAEGSDQVDSTLPI